MKWHDVKPLKRKKDEPIEAPGGREYPFVSIPLRILPVQKDWRPGETYVVGMKIKMKSLNMSEHSDREARDYENNGEYDVRAIAVMPKSKPKRYSRVKA